ncbi:DUF4249 domain-containing protein [Bacteroidota bacterium]
MRKIIFIFLILASCIDPYDFSQNDSPAYLAVEGYVSNKIGDSEIRLSRSMNFQQNTNYWVSNAEVMVIENEADEHLYTYHDNGLYKPVQEEFFARKESTYRLRIVLEGQIYESEQVILQNSHDIDDLSFKSAPVNQQGDLLEHPRLKLLLTSNIDENASRYYLYTVEETWLARAIFPRTEEIRPTFTFNENRTPINIKFETEYVEDVSFCWPSKKAVGINTATTEGLSRNQLINVPVFSVNLESDRLLYKYSALINQYAISQEAHHFFNMLKEFSENSGFLYDIQPGFISGNIHNISTPEDWVVGIFYAASHTSSRIFISNEDLSPEESFVVDKYWPKCVYVQHVLDNYPSNSIPDEELTSDLQYLLDSLIWDKGLVIRNKSFRVGASGCNFVLELSYLHCIDCRVYGSNVKPDWWGSIY